MSDGMKENKNLRDTRSVCPCCLKEIEAQIIEKDGCVFMSKECSEHGSFEIKISNNAKRYLDRYNFFTELISPDYRRCKKLLYVSSECNLDCPICFYRLTENNVPLALDFSDIEKLAKTNFVLILFGREPCCRSDIIDVIKMMKKNKKHIFLQTNGVKIADYDFSVKLKEAGVDKIIMQFDGFKEDIYKTIRGANQLLEKKLKALENLKHLGMSVVINDTVMEGVNESSMKEIIDFAVQNSFITGILYLGYGAWGEDAQPQRTVNVEQLLEILEKQTGGKISSENVLIFQKLLYIYLNTVRQGGCILYQNYWIYRNNGDYIPIDRVLDMKRLDVYLTNYLEHYFKKGRKKLGLLYVIWGVLRSLKNYRLLAMMFRDGLKTIIKRNASGGFIPVNFITPCDHYRYEDQILNYCETDLIYKDSSGEVKYQPHTKVLVELWKKNLAEQALAREVKRTI